MTMSSDLSSSLELSCLRGHLYLSKYCREIGRLFYRTTTFSGSWLILFKGSEKCNESLNLESPLELLILKIIPEKCILIFTHTSLSFEC